GEVRFAVLRKGGSLAARGVVGDRKSLWGTSWPDRRVARARPGYRHRTGAGLCVRGARIVRGSFATIRRNALRLLRPTRSVLLRRTDQPQGGVMRRGFARKRAAGGSNNRRHTTQYAALVAPYAGRAFT